MTATTDLQALALQAGEELEDASATEILRWASEQFGSNWCVTSSMADAVLPHLAAQVLPGVDIIFLDTGYHFAETIGMRDAVAAVLPVNVRTMLPLKTVAEQDAEFGAKEPTQPVVHDERFGRVAARRERAHEKPVS